jgi:HD-GYP domain-containing protein (c-di-GMP phosphodiesterase class II)
MFTKKEQEELEHGIRSRDKEIRTLEARVLAQDETMSNINRILESQDRAMNALTTLQHLYATAANIREVAVPFLELAIKAARCEGGILAMRESPQAPLAVLGAIGDRQEVVRQQIFNEGEGLIGEVVKTGMPLLVPDARREPRLRREGPDFLQREARNALCIPVSGASCVWGALLLVNTVDRKRFTKQDVDLQAIFTMRLARELEREAEFGRAREEATRLSTLLRATELLHVASDKNKVSELLVQLATRLTRAQGAAVFLMEENAQMLTCFTASEKLLRPVVVPAGTGVAGWVALEGKPVNASVIADARFAGQFEAVFNFRAENVLAVPIRGGAQRILGVLEAANKEGGRLFDQSDVNLLSLLAREAGISMDHLALAHSNQRTIMELLRGMAKYIDAKSPQLTGHSERVAKISQVIAEEMKLSTDEVGQAYLAGLLHDIGNVGVDDDVFMAPRALTEEETRRVKHHASIGAEILSEVAALRHLMVGPLYHHERYDGTGYPQGLKGEAIPMLARIVGAAEAYDALRSPRPHREALSLPDTLGHLRSSAGTVFDANVISVLISAYQRGKLPA